LNIGAIAVEKAVPGTRGFLGTGVGSTVDPKIDTLNIGFCVHHREARRSRRTEVSPGGRLARDCVMSGWRLTAVRTVKVLAEAGTVACSWATARRFAFSWKRAELGPGGLARAVDRSRPLPCLEATSTTTDQVVLEALGLLQSAGYPKIPSG
jgi:hypothetical protein